jgi:dihydrofolate reductase
MKAIVAVNKNWAIGKNGQLMYSIPGDMRFFRETTKGNTVVMGRKTLDSFPGGLPLKNRTNIVITSSPDSRENVVWANSPIDALKKVDDINQCFLIGGASIYKELIEYCTEAYVTVIDDNSEGDSYFPNLDEMDNWTLFETSEEFFENGFSYKFCKFKNNNPKEI